jgi:sugar phosphate isomerase/epimerase
MERVLSTYLYAEKPLTLSLLAEIAAAGIPAIELFCLPYHFDYRAPQKVRELADWLGEHRLKVHALHSPMERDMLSGKRDSGMPISISDPERLRRLDAVDEVKRALEVAESIPFRFLVQHLDSGKRMADQRRFDAAFNSLEHLAIFAKQREVVIALENTPGDLTSPSSLRHFIVDTRLNDLKMCFDTGHAHMEDGIGASFDLMRERVVTTHLHDNHGEKDEHQLPYQGTIDWDAALKILATAPQELPIVLELKEHGANLPTLPQIAAVFEKIEKNLNRKH